MLPDADHDTAATSKAKRDADYEPSSDGNPWYDENGDGNLIGWSLAEDSAIWNTKACAAKAAGLVEPERSNR